MTETIAQHATRLARELGVYPRRDVDVRASAALRELAAAHEAMTRERDEARKEAAGYDTMLHAACDQRDALAAEVAALREALQPFAAEANRIDPLPGNGACVITDGVEVWQNGTFDIRRSRITYGDLRAARAALAAGKERAQ